MLFWFHKYFVARNVHDLRRRHIPTLGVSLHVAWPCANSRRSCNLCLSHVCFRSEMSKRWLLYALRAFQTEKRRTKHYTSTSTIYSMEMSFSIVILQRSSALLRTRIEHDMPLCDYVWCVHGKHKCIHEYCGCFVNDVLLQSENFACTWIRQKIRVGWVVMEWYFRRRMPSATSAQLLSPLKRRSKTVVLFLNDSISLNYFLQTSGVMLWFPQEFDDGDRTS